MVRKPEDKSKAGRKKLKDKPMDEQTIQQARMEGEGVRPEVIVDRLGITKFVYYNHRKHPDYMEEVEKWRQKRDMDMVGKIIEEYHDLNLKAMKCLGNLIEKDGKKDLREMEFLKGMADNFMKSFSPENPVMEQIKEVIVRQTTRGTKELPAPEDESDIERARRELREEEEVSEAEIEEEEEPDQTEEEEKDED